MTDLLAAPPVERTDLRDQVHTILRAEIIQGRLEPGDRLHVGRLADRLGVSPTPVKEALSRLTAEGLVKLGARGGTFVTRPTQESVDDIFELRELLEQYAAERAIARATERDIEQLDALADSIKTRVNPDGTLAYDGFASDDIAFHNLLVGLAGNERLAHMYQELHVYTIVARSYYRLQAKQPEQPVGNEHVYTEHKAIVAALRAKDVGALRAAISDHLAKVRTFGHRAAALFEAADNVQPDAE